MTCAEFRKLIRSFISTLSDEAEEKFDRELGAHVDVCPGCAEWMEQDSEKMMEELALELAKRKGQRRKSAKGH